MTPLRVTVFQSAPDNRPAWIDGCLASVRDWSARQGFEYRFIGDELFESLPEFYAQKVAGRGPILADLARLQVLQSHQQSEGDVACWVDADTLCLDQDWCPEFRSHSVFGEEYWVQSDPDKGGRLEGYRNPHNAFMMFRTDSPVLPFLRFATESIIGRADPAYIAPQLVGPKLVKALHNIAGFELCPAAGALSPTLMQAAVQGLDAPINYYRQGCRGSVALVNLCQSLVATESALSSVERLVAEPRLLDWMTE